MCHFYFDFQTTYHKFCFSYNCVAKIFKIDSIMKADCHTGVNMEVTRAELCAHARGLPLNHQNVVFACRKKEYA